MKRFGYVSVFLVLSAAGLALLQTGAVGQTSASKAAVPDSHAALIETYCVDCHNKTMKTGGVMFDTLDIKHPAANAEIWEKALHKLRGRLMPPPGNPQPSQAEIDAFSTWMEATLDAAPAPVTAGHVPVERLNRTEYVASVKELLGVDVNEKDILPQDVQVEGFDNIASVLSTSPAFLDQYLDAARRVAKRAVGDMAPPISSTVFQTEGNQDPALPMPPGMRGAMKFEHSFPADGEYRFSFFDLDIGLYNSQMQNMTTLVLMVDDKVVFKGNIGGAEDLRLANVKGTDGWQQILDRFQKIPVKLLAGKHEIIAGYIDRSHVQSDDNVGGGGGGGGGRGAAPMSTFRRAIDVLEIKGPFKPTGISISTTRPLIFICDPAKTGEAPCAKQIAENLAHRAYRRPVAEADVTRLMNFYNEGRLENGTFDQGITEVVAAVLASPDFLLRVQTVNGSFVIEQRLRVWVECRTNNQAGKFSGGGCSAHVDVLRAPQGKLDALVALVDAHDLTKPVNDPQWLAAYMQRQQREGANRIAALRETEARQSAVLRAQFEQIQETMARNHAAFMAQQESQFHSAMNNANNAMNARTTAASDWVDYVLDQQTVTGSGGTVKVSSAYSQTWSNGQNQWFQTNNPNSNPNGVLPGNWTQNTKVHGNGQP